MKKKELVSIILNITLFAFALFTQIDVWFLGWLRSPTMAFGTNLRYFTEISNLSAGIVGLLFALAIIFKWEKAKNILSYFKLVTTVMLFITFFVVAVYLNPVLLGWAGLFGPMMIFVHLINPLIAMTAYIFFDDIKDMSFKAGFFVLISMGLYAFVWVVYMLIVKDDSLAPYPFLEIYTQPWWATIIWFLGMFGFGYLATFGFIKLKNLTNKKLK